MNNFNDSARLKILLYQYLSFKSSRIHDDAELSLKRLYRLKNPTSEDFFETYRKLLLCDLFDELDKEIGSLFDL